MKKLILSITAVIFLGGILFAGQEQTIENLKAAFKGETTASAKYAKFADQARKEGFVQIAIMFSATSKAEAIHADNHRKVLEKMGQQVENFIPQFVVKSTRENLQEALNGESYEVATMYPDFIAKAKDEGATDAVKSFRWAMDTEKKHGEMYKKALAALTTNTVSGLPKIYWVCPKCGNTYDVIKPEAQCSFCGTGSSKFLKFDK